MNIYEKMAVARLELQSCNLKKSGHNKFAGYDYFELADLMPAINKIMAAHRLLGVCSFGLEMATLTIIDAEKPDGPTLEFICPMSTAELKGCHPVQNLGAVQTYTRRYLWTAAFEIVEADALDATQGKPEKAKPANQTDDDPLGTGGTDKRPPARGGAVCEVCGATMTPAQQALSRKKFDGRLLCPACQVREGGNA